MRSGSDDEIYCCVGPLPGNDRWRVTFFCLRRTRASHPHHPASSQSYLVAARRIFRIRPHHLELQILLLALGWRRTFPLQSVTLASGTVARGRVLYRPSVLDLAPIEAHRLIVADIPNRSADFLGGVSGDFFVLSFNLCQPKRGMIQ
jgi:hypothetical protein